MEEEVMEEEMEPVEEMPVQEAPFEEELITYTVTLADGTALDNLRLNGNNYISDTKVTAADFEGKLDNVTIDGSDGYREVIRDAELVQATQYGDEYWFILREMPEEEKQRQTIAALEDALCEADIANEEWKASIEDALCEISAESEGE